MLGINNRDLQTFKVGRGDSRGVSTCHATPHAWQVDLGNTAAIVALNPKP